MNSKQIRETVLRASAIGANALRMLDCLRTGRQLTVGSNALLFRRSADLILGDSLLAITLGGLRSGFSIVARTDYPTDLRRALGNPRPGSVVMASVESGPLRLSLRCGEAGVEIVLEGTEVWMPNCFSASLAESFNTSEAGRMIPNLSRLLAFTAAACGSCPPKEVLELTEHAARSAGSDPDQAAKLIRLLSLNAGVGDGLTPASDDVLLGASVIYKCLSRVGVVTDSSLLNRVIEEARHRTSRLSYLILRESLRGGVNEGLDNLVCGLLRSNWRTASEGVAELMMVGGDSGASMGLGAMLAFSTILKLDSSRIFKIFRNICSYKRNS